MNYFVAEDVVHRRVGGRPFYVSQCGFEYASIAVDWAGDYKPRAWSRCTACDGVSPNTAAPAEDQVVVQGIYAVDDDAHLQVGRADGAWLSVCGRKDANSLVAWAGDGWPEVYDACGDCIALVDADLWESDLPDDPVQGEQTASAGLEERLLDHRVWVNQNGVEHRPSDEGMTLAMCGAKLRAGTTPLLIPTAEATHCHDCDRAVGQARAATRAPKPNAKGKPAPRSSLSKRGAKRETSAPTSVRRRRSSTEKEVALFGRRMVLPVRFVRGGLPSLGRRR